MCFNIVQQERDNYLAVNFLQGIIDQLCPFHLNRCDVRVCVLYRLVAEAPAEIFEDRRLAGTTPSDQRIVLLVEVDRDPTEKLRIRHAH